MDLCAYFYWDPSRELLRIPFFNRPILWYGFFFALGFFIGYWVLRYLLRKPLSSPSMTKIVAERISLYVILGAVIGARLGDLIFYQNALTYLRNPLEIFKVWEGGLASHGGAIGVMVALFILSIRRTHGVKNFSWLGLLDLVVIPAALAGSLIRIGNFFNQEILGKGSHLPWAVVFGHPADGSFPEPRHPVQLYESVYYFLVFALLFALWNTTSIWKEKGKVCGLFLVLVFTFRIAVEFLKEEQSALLSTSAFLNMGQLLSTPFVLIGCYLMFKRRRGS